jgi:hypothetical protein
MTTAHIAELDFEVDRVEQWRLASLERAGYALESAAVLPASPEVDPHAALTLLEQGCSVDLALRILL